MRGLILVLACLAGLAAADERPPEVARALGGAELRGAATVDFLAFPLYEAQLWTPDRQSVDRADSFALSLIYKRGFTARSLARASVSEMARIAGRPRSEFARLEDLLHGCFADVTAEDRITGLSTGRDTATFFVNGRRSCDLRYPDLRGRFFGIWLGRDSRDPGVTAQLRGRP